MTTANDVMPVRAVVPATPTSNSGALTVHHGRLDELLGAVKFEFEATVQDAAILVQQRDDLERRGRRGCSSSVEYAVVFMPMLCFPTPKCALHVWSAFSDAECRPTDRPHSLQSRHRSTSSSRCSALSMR